MFHSHSCPVCRLTWAHEIPLTLALCDYEHFCPGCGREITLRDNHGDEPSNPTCSLLPPDRYPWVLAAALKLNKTQLKAKRLRWLRRKSNGATTQ